VESFRVNYNLLCLWNKLECRLSLKFCVTRNNINIFMRLYTLMYGGMEIEVEVSSR